MALPQPTYRAGNVAAPDFTSAINLIQRPGALINDYIDREDKRSRQAELDRRAGLLFEQQQADRAAQEQARLGVAQGPQAVSGILTDRVQASGDLTAKLNQNALTADEIALTRTPEFNTMYGSDTGYDLGKLRASGQTALADKLANQMVLSEAGTKLGETPIMESRAQMFDRILKEQASKGLVPSADLVKSAENARLAETQAREAERKVARETLADINKEERKYTIDLAKALDKARTASGGGSISQKDIASNRAGISDIITEAVKVGEVSGKEGNDIKRTALQAYDSLIKEGIDPITAKDIISNSVRTTPDKWYTFGGDVNIDADFRNQLTRDALRASANAPGVGKDAEVLALTTALADVANRKASASGDLAKSLLTNEQGQFGRVDKLLGGFGTQPITSTVNKPATTAVGSTSIATQDGKETTTKGNNGLITPKDETKGREIYQEQLKLLDNKEAIKQDTSLTTLEKTRALNAVDDEIAKIAEDIPIKDEIRNRIEAAFSSDKPLSLNPKMEPITFSLLSAIRDGKKGIDFIKSNLAEPLAEFMEDSKPSDEAKRKVAEQIKQFLPSSNPFNLTETDKKALATSIGKRYSTDEDEFLKSPLGGILLDSYNWLVHGGTTSSDETSQPLSFRDQQLQTYNRLKDMGFTDSEIQQASDQLLASIPKYTRNN